MNRDKRHIESNRIFKILRLFCPSHLYEEIEGDLIQKFEQDSKRFGEVRAKRRLIWNAIRFFRPEIVSRNKFSNQQKQTMISSYLRFSWRSIARHKVFSIINVTGLAIGMAVCLLILNYVMFEKSYDTFFDRHQDIIRVGYSRFIDNELQYNKAQIFPAVGETLKESIPAIENYTRLFPITTHVEAVLWVEEDGNRKDLIEPAVYAVDSSFLKVFSMHLLRGNPLTALIGEKKLLLSESAALKFFGHTDVLDKTIHWDGMGDWLVTGVFEDLPTNSHMQFDLLISWMDVYGEKSAWNWDGFYTYLLLRPDAHPDATERLAQHILDEKTKGTENANRVTSKFFFQPIDDIHLRSQLTGEMQPNGNAEVVKALQLVACVILALALINYINLSVARAIKRSKEIGVRKIIGSSQIQLSILFFTESFLVNLIGFAIAITLVYSLSDLFSLLAGKIVSIVIWTDPALFASTSFGILVLFSLLAGFYPARILSSFSPIAAMKSSVSVSGGKGVRRSLLVIQFLITMVLVTMTLVIKNQISFMQNQELGFALHQNVVIKSLATAGAEMDSTFINNMELFKARIKENAHIVNATITSNIPGRENEWLGRLRRSEQDKELISTSRTRVDKDFIQTYGLSLVAGRNFSNENPNQVILNQSTAKMLGYKTEQEAIGNKLMSNFEIVGVVKDFHERSIHELITSAMYTPGQGYMKFITVNVNTTNFNGALPFLKQQWKSVFPDKPFEYFLLDEFFNRQYNQEQQLSNVFQYFSAIGLGIACLGLFGFTYFITHQRTREIGIRKTLGASLKNIIQLLSSELALFLLIAGLLAGPVSYYLADHWLSEYPVRAIPGFVIFVLPVLLVSFFAFTSIIILLIRSARTNPVEAIRHE